MLEFAANMCKLFEEYPFLMRFDAAKKIGLKYFELEFPYDHTPAEIRMAASGMKCQVINSFVDESDGTFGYASVPGQQWKFCESLTKISPYYFELGMQKVNIICGLKANCSEEEQLNTFVGNLQSMAEFLENFDMIALIEPLCEEVKPGYFLNSYELAMKALKAANMDNVKILLDIYNLHKITGNVNENLEKYYPYAGHVQISQSPGRCEPYFNGGEIDYDFVFNFLKSKNHSDPIGLEYFPSSGLTTEQSLDWMKKIL